jgi:hypothetical protein
LSHQLHQSLIKNQKPKNILKNRPKQPKLKNLFLDLDTFILTLGDSISLEKKKKKKLKTSEKTFDFEPFSPSKENPNF